MNLFPPEYPFLIALTVGVIGIALLPDPSEWYLVVAPLALFWGVFVLTRTWDNRGFYLVCGGEPLVVACSILNPLAGLFSVWMLAGIACGAWGLLASRRDLISFALFCAGSLGIALFVQATNHVLFALLVIGSITAVILAIQSVRAYQFRRQFTGA